MANPRIPSSPPVLVPLGSSSSMVGEKTEEIVEKKGRDITVKKLLPTSGPLHLLPPLFEVPPTAASLPSPSHTPLDPVKRRPNREASPGRPPGGQHGAQRDVTRPCLRIYPRVKPGWDNLFTSVGVHKKTPPSIDSPFNGKVRCFTHKISAGGLKPKPAA